MIATICAIITTIIFMIFIKKMIINIESETALKEYEKELTEEKIKELKEEIKIKNRILENQDMLTLELIDYIDTKTDKLRIENNNKIENQEKLANLIKEIKETMEEMEIESINIEKIKKGDNQNGWLYRNYWNNSRNNKDSSTDWVSDWTGRMGSWIFY